MQVLANTATHEKFYLLSFARIQGTSAQKIIVTFNEQEISKLAELELFYANGRFAD